VAEQRLHSAMAPIDVLTRIELEETMHRELNAAVRARYTGIDSARFSRVYVNATAATVNLFASPNEAPAGPEQGDVWLVRRVLVASSVTTDTAKYILFRGSAPSDPNAYQLENLLDVIIGGATPGQNVNVGFYPSTKSILLQPGEQIYAQILGATAGNIYALSGEAIRVPAEMKGKVL
jgi:hypothetical protein